MGGGGEFHLQKEGAFPMTQNRALQLLYDLRYLSIVLTPRGEEVKGGRSKQDSRYPFPLGFSQCSLFQMQTAPFVGNPRVLLYISCLTSAHITSRINNDHLLDKFHGQV